MDVRFDERAINSILAEFDEALPGAAVGLAINGNVRVRCARGRASARLSVPLAPDMRMRIGSVTKSFTCLALLLLCEDGLADPEDALGCYVQGLAEPAASTSLRQLMAHQSGLGDAIDICWQFSGPLPRVSSVEIVDLYRQPIPPCFAPGESFLYNNGAYVLLSAAVEAIAGAPLEAVLAERIFTPLGLRGSALVRSDASLIANSATLHVRGAADGYDRSPMNTELAGEGGMVSTIDDLLAWLAHIDAPHIGRPETWDLLTRAGRLPGGADTGYGLGWGIGRYRGMPTLFHAGGALGGNAFILKLREAAIDIAVIVNRDDLDAPALAYRLLDACLPSAPSPGAARTGPVLDGLYHSRRSRRTVVLHAKDGVQRAMVDGFDFPLMRCDDAHWAPPTELGLAASALQFAIDGDVLRLIEFGRADILDAVTAGPTETRAWKGRYRSAETGTEIWITEANGTARCRSIGRFGCQAFNITPLAPHLWRASAAPAPWGGVLAFDAEGLHFSSFRTRGLRFARIA